MRMPARLVPLAVVLALSAVTALASAGSPARQAPAAKTAASPSTTRSTTSWSLPAVAGQAAPVKESTQAGLYIVVLEAPPVALYEGDQNGLAATSPQVTGAARLDTDSAASRAYVRFLDSAQGQFVTTLEREFGRAMSVKVRYRYALDGMAVWLTPEEAGRVAAMPGVVSVTPNTPQPVDTDAGPRWIGAPGVWDGSALGQPTGTMGEGIVVGLVDTGINIDHPSFAEVDKNGYEFVNPRGHYFGFCDPANPHYDVKWKCNQKLIGLYSFLDVPTNAFNPEDDNGHGSHTSSTAAGNFVTAPYRAPTITLNLEVSGVAPHANIIMYDACYTTSNGLGSCPPDATLAALEQALVDQVDVVNYSISTGQNSPWTDPHQLAFRAMRAAGIFAAISAGNDGPTASTTSALAPWVTAVAATTNDRVFQSSLINMTGGDTTPPADMTGQALTSGYGPAPIVYAGNGKFKNATGAVDDGSCSQAFAAGTFSGQIVVCDRLGNTARVQRAANVRAGGAGGFVLANVAEQGAATVADPHVLPAVHLSYADGVTLKAWLSSGTGQTATISGTSVQYVAAVADQMAAFSSRGPAVSEFCCRRPDLPQTYQDYFPVLKPDVGAPGSEVIAAVASGTGVEAPEFASYSGTSMSSPHVAGAAALMISARPDWTMAEVQSALMSTSVVDTVRKEDGVTPASPFDIGAGRIDVSKAVQAGLVLDTTMAEYDAADPAKGGDPSTLNLASLIDTKCLDRCDWTRTVKSTLDHAVTWTVTPVVPPASSGMEVTVTPSQFTLAPGATQTLAIEADVTTLARNSWAFASIDLLPIATGAAESHLTMAVLPVPALLPNVVPIYTLEPEGHTTVPAVAMEISDLQVAKFGLIRGQETDVYLAQDPNPGDRFTLTQGKAVVTMTVPANSPRIVAEVIDSTSKDIDMLMGIDLNGDGKPQSNELLCVSFGESYQEFCEIAAQGVPASTFWVVLQNFEASDSAPDLTKVVTAAVRNADEGNMTVTAPSSVPYGQPFDLDIGWDLPGIQAGDRWYGMVTLGSSPFTPDDLGTFMVDVIGRQPPEPTPTNTPLPATATNTPLPATSTPVWAAHLFLPKTYRESPPTATPTSEPTMEPTMEPTAEPTAEPTGEQTAEPTAETTTEPTAEPTAEPTGEPTGEPTAEPTAEPLTEPPTAPTNR